jgi:hypothetical protein
MGIAGNLSCPQKSSVMEQLDHKQFKQENSCRLMIPAASLLRVQKVTDNVTTLRHKPSFFCGGGTKAGMAVQDFIDLHCLHRLSGGE